MSVFRLFSDKKYSILLYAIIVSLFFFLFFCLVNKISIKYIVMYSFVKQNNIETLVRTSDNCGRKEDFLYIYASPGVDISSSLPNYEVLMQTEKRLCFESDLASNEILITTGIARKGKLKIGDEIEIKKIYESDYKSYKIKDIIQNPYLKLTSGIFKFTEFMFLPYDSNYEKMLEFQYIVLSKKKFLELPNDLVIHAKYVWIKKEIFKEVLSVHIILFLAVLCVYFVIYELSKNLFHENLFKRVYNLFNQGQRKVTNIGILLSLICIIQLIPMQVAVFASYILTPDILRAFDTLIINSCFNISLLIIMFLETYYRDMKQGRTALL